MAQWFSKSFYQSKQWKTARNSKMASVNNLCELCLEKGKISAAKEVHHKIHLTPQNINDPNIAYAHSNLLALCKFCHQKEHRPMSAIQDGLYFNERGEVMSEDYQPPKKRIHVHIVWGCYGSGKTTYVRQHMDRGDLVVDLDLIGQAISMCDKTDVPKNLLYTSLKVRDFIYQLIASKDINAKNVWVVGGLPTKTERESLKERIDADLIYMDVTKEECIRRVMLDVERKDKQKQTEIIEQWWNKHEI